MSNSQSLCFDKDSANGFMREAIIGLKEGFSSENFWLWPQRLCLAILIRTELQGRGFKWQADRINNWIHFYQGKINRLHAGGAGVTSERERERRPPTRCRRS